MDKKRWIKGKAMALRELGSIRTIYEGIKYVNLVEIGAIAKISYTGVPVHLWLQTHDCVS